MPLPRTHLGSSTFWSVRRPKSTLAEGHFVLRLNDPSLTFDLDSAADLLRCYGRLRRAVIELAGATAAQLHLALNWQPVGDAVGDPVAETSTPTLHVFFAQPGSPTAASALTLPAHQRTAQENTGELDERLRSRLGGAAPATFPAPEPLDPAAAHPLVWPDDWESRAFHVEPATPAPGTPFRGGHWTGVPRRRVASLDQLSPAAVVELAQGIEVLASHSQPPFAGMTVWVCDDWTSPAPQTFHIFGRSHGDARPHLSAFVHGGGLNVPLPDVWQGKSSGPSPIVEK